MFTKKELRKQVTKKRLEMATTNALTICSSMIVSKILSSEEFKNAQNVALYCPLKGEVDIMPLLKVKDKNFYIPRCKEDDLEFVKFNGYENLKRGAFSILEPIGEKIDPEILDIIYIPALMANTKCYRLGWGKGFYDKFFKKHEIKAKKIIVVSNCFISDDFKEDNHDFKCDCIISEN